MRVELVQRLRAKFARDAEPALWTQPFLSVCGTHLFAYGSYAAVNPTFAAYLSTITRSESFIGVAFGVFTFAAVAARPVTGWLLDRTGRRAVQAVAAVALAGVTLLFSWAAALWAVLVLRVAHGLVWGVSSTATPTLAADVVPETRRSEGFAFFGVVPNLALMTLPPAGLWVAHRFGFGAQFVGAASLALLALGPLRALDDADLSTGGLGTVYAPRALPAAVIVGLASVPLGAIDALLPLYASVVGLANAGAFFTVMGGAIILARAALGRLPASAPMVLGSSFVCEAGGLALLAFVPRLVVVRGVPLGLLAGAALFGLGFALVFPLLQSAAVSAASSDRTGSATATVLIGMDLGIGVGAIAFGVLGGLTGFVAVYATAAVFPLGALLAATVARPGAAGS